MRELLGIQLKEWLIAEGLSEYWAVILQSAIAIVIVLIAAWISDIITKKVTISIITKLVKKTKTEWDDILLKRKVFNRLSHFAPAFLIYHTSNLIDHQGLSAFVESSTYLFMIFLALLVLDTFLNAANDIYNTYPISRNRPIKGYIQVVKIFFYTLGIISIIAILIDKDPWNLIAGMSAFAAVLILVFKDTILGFVASIQLSANKMVSIGDWISMPSHNADGTVIDVSLNTVKIQNWDKTISTVPTYALVSESFNNWKGMEESGGRRIKRHLNIDMSSIHFLSQEEMDNFENITLIKEYIQKKREEIKKANPQNEIPVNQHRLTNVGTFRKYIEAYLHQNPLINDQMTFLVRQLQPSETGLPIEIYVFSRDQRWANYEAIQSDIFDHVLSIVPEFGLRVFQNPSGQDFKKIIN